LTLAIAVLSADACGCQLFDVFEALSEYQRDVLDHMSRQFRCARLCAERNRQVRKSSLSHADVSVMTETSSLGPRMHQVSVKLPMVEPSDVTVKIVGDDLMIHAFRTWRTEMLPEMTEGHQKCGCVDIGADLIGTTDRLSTQLRIPSTCARERIDVEFRRESEELVISLPEKEPATLTISVREASSEAASPSGSDIVTVQGSEEKVKRDDVSPRPAEL